MSVRDCITSFVDGRVRLRHPALKESATAELVTSVVRGVEGILSVQANPVTGSLLIFYDPDKLSRDQLLELAEQGAAFVPGMREALADEGETGVGQAARAVKAVKNQPLVDDVLRILSRRSTVRFVNRTMFVALAASLVGLSLGCKRLHVAAGGVFVSGVFHHFLAHRKSF